MLIGKEPKDVGKQNPRDIDFIEGIKAAASNVKTGLLAKRLPWANGLIHQNQEYAIVDVWGNFYRVRLDGDGDQQVANPDPGEAAAGRPKLPLRGIVWSAGKDRKDETWEDYPKSWNLRGPCAGTARPAGSGSLGKFQMPEAWALPVLWGRRDAGAPSGFPDQTSSSAICTALRAAPLRSWSPTTQKARPLSRAQS